MVFPHAASGGAAFKEASKKVIRLARHGCTNRPFYHIVVMESFAEQFDPCIEQVGTFDPIPNKYNEKLVALNYDRIQYWIKKKARISEPVAELLGLSGFLPVHPRTYMRAWRFRRGIMEEIEKLGTTAAAPDSEAKQEVTA